MEETVSPKRPNRPKKYEKIPPSPYAPLFIEKLLLAIIEKNEVPANIYDVSETVHLPSIRFEPLKIQCGRLLCPSRLNETAQTKIDSFAQIRQAHLFFRHEQWVQWFVGVSFL